MLQKRRWIILLLAALFLALFLCAAQAEGAQVSGSVFVDKNNNGKKDSGEAALPYARVFLQRRSGSDAKDVSSATIGKNGEFAFAVNQAGDYRLRVELPREYNIGAPGKDNAAIPSLNYKSVTPFFTLKNGDSRVVNLSGTKSTTSLSVIAFEDSNANGGRSSSEPLLRNAVVEVLYELDGETYLIGQGKTDKKGALVLSGFPPASYRLRVTLPDNYVIGPMGEKINTWYNCINASESNVGLSDPIEFQAGRTAGVGIGAVKTGALEGTLWYDANFNGKRDSNEKGLADATVTLTSSALNLTREANPDKNGYYHFPGLQPGTYKVCVQLKEGLVFTYPGVSPITAIGSYGETTATVQVEKKTTVKDIGAMPAAKMTLSFFVDANMNDAKDKSDSGLQGVAVTVSQMGQEVERKSTGKDGAVTFSSLRSGSVDIQCTLPNGYIFEIAQRKNGFSVTEVTDRLTAQMTLNGSTEGQASLSVTVPAAIRGKLFEDPTNTGVFTEDCDGLAGFTVQAVQDSGKVLAQAVTDAMGAYALYPLPAGAYTVRFLLNDPYVASPHTKDNAIVSQSPAYGETEKITLKQGQSAEKIDGAVFRAGVVEGYVLNAEKKNKSGLRGVTTTLLNADGTPVSDYAYGVTDENGYFMIKGVLPGDYAVRYTLPKTVALADSDDTEFTTASFAMTSGKEYRLPDVSGVYTASVSGTVGRDSKNPVSARITLTNQATGEKKTATSSAKTGKYSFTRLRPGKYTFEAELPDGYVFGQLATSPLGPKSAAKDSVTLTLKAEDQVRADVCASLPVTLRGTVFYDADRSGVQDGKESGAANRTLTLWMGSEKAADLTTDKKGAFRASGLVPGDYTLRIELQDHEILEGIEAQQKNNTWSVAVSLYQDQTVTVPVLQYASVSGAVWNLDKSLNNVAGITVTLQDSNGLAVGTKTTNDKGEYSFSRLLPGKYTLSAALPDGFLFAKKDDTKERKSVIQSQANGSAKSVAFTVSMGKQLTGIDIGIGAIGSIGDKAWLDENGNGMQDIGEPGIPGIKIALYRNGELAASTTTDLYGRYMLENLYPGEYEMRVTMQKELKATKHVTTFPLVASIMPQSDKTTVSVAGVVVPSGQKNLHCDLGFQLRKAGVYPAVMKQIPQKDWTPYAERTTKP